MTWNHRIIRQRAPDAEREVDGEEFHYTIREVYYDRDGKPKMVMMEADGPFGLTMDELRQDVKRFFDAFHQPTLNYEDFDKPADPLVKDAVQRSFGVNDDQEKQGLTS